MFANAGLSTWLLISCVVLWTISIALFFIFRFSGKKALRRGDFDASPQEPGYGSQQHHFGAQIQHELLCQHIDAIFNSMAALVEAERMKLKTLIAFQSPRPEAVNTPAPIPAQNRTAASPSASEQDDDASRELTENTDIMADISRLSRQGMGHDEISYQLGISRNEVLLAAKMQSGRGAIARTGRLNAVA